MKLSIVFFAKMEAEIANTESLEVQKPQRKEMIGAIGIKTEMVHNKHKSVTKHSNSWQGKKKKRRKCVFFFQSKSKSSKEAAEKKIKQFEKEHEQEKKAKKKSGVLSWFQKKKCPSDTKVEENDGSCQVRLSNASPSLHLPYSHPSTFNPSLLWMFLLFPIPPLLLLLVPPPLLSSFHPLTLYLLLHLLQPHCLTTTLPPLPFYLSFNHLSCEIKIMFFIIINPSIFLHLSASVMLHAVVFDCCVNTYGHDLKRTKVYYSCISKSVIMW